MNEFVGRIQDIMELCTISE